MDNIFEGLTYRFYILLLNDFIFDFQNKKKIYKLKLCLNCFGIIIQTNRYIIPTKILFAIIFVMGRSKIT